MSFKKLILLSILALTACGSKETEVETPPSPEVVNLDKKASTEENSTEVSLDELKDFLYEKLEGQKLVRNYGEDTAWTDMTFAADGSFKGTYMGKYQNDGFDGGMREFAENVYLGEEIHLSEFTGSFEITEQVNDYVYKLTMNDFEITSEYGVHDAIYFNVDFALGMNADAEYFLYIPGTPKANLPNADTKLDQNYRLEDFEEDKTQGFIIWNKTDDEVFNQLRSEYESQNIEP